MVVETIQVAFPGDLVSPHILVKSLWPYSGPTLLLRYLPYILYLVYPLYPTACILIVYYLQNLFFFNDHKNIALTR